MDTVERAIRRAFEKGDAQDRAFREKVYRSAFGALDRAIKANPTLTREVIRARLDGLKRAITDIETEYLPAIAPATPPPAPARTPVAAEPAPAPVAAPAAPPLQPAAAEPAPPLAPAEPEPASPPSSDAAAGQQVEPAPAPVEAVSTEPVAAPAVAETSAAAGLAPADAAPAPPPETQPAPSPAAAGASPEAVLRLAGDAPVIGPAAAYQETAGQRRRRRPYAAAFIAAVLIVAVGIVAFFAYDTGLFKSAAERDDSVPNPPVQGSEDFDPNKPDGPPGQAGTPGQGRNWITVFNPADTTAVTTPADARADFVRSGEEQVVRINGGASGSAVLFDIGQGVLEQIAGKHATFNIIARAEEGKPTEISVECNFAELGDCGRRRYAVKPETGDFLFDIDPKAARPGAGGTIAINSDLSRSGKAVDIIQIRVSVGPK